MKRTVLLATALTLASTAAADQVGVFLVGGQYQQDNGLRYGVGLPVVSFFGGAGGLALSGDVSYLIPAGAANSGLDTYYGFGLGASFVLATGSGASVGGLSLTPNVLAGVNFNTGSAFTPFLEGSVGPTIAFATASGGGSTSSGLGLGFGFGLRLGVNYRLN